jgi:hypothetical protein
MEVRALWRVLVFQTFINPVELPSGSFNGETHHASKRRPPSRRDDRPPRTHFGLDAGRRPNGIHQRPPRGRQTLPGISFPSNAVLRNALTPKQLSDVAEGLRYLHSCDVVHGDLKAVRDCCSVDLSPSH